MINETTTLLIDKIDKLVNEIEKAKKSLFIQFEVELKDTMKKHNINSVNVRVNNHEFADGEATSFSLYYDDCINFTYTDESGKKHEYEEDNDKYDDNGNESEKYKKLETIIKELKELFSAFDRDSLYEDNFSDEYGTIKFSIEDGKLTYGG